MSQFSGAFSLVHLAELRKQCLAPPHEGVWSSWKDIWHGEPLPRTPQGTTICDVNLYTPFKTLTMRSYVSSCSFPESDLKDEQLERTMLETFVGLLLKDLCTQESSKSLAFHTTLLCLRTGAASVRLCNETIKSVQKSMLLAPS